jgi:hypothetical protein
MGDRSKNVEKQALKVVIGRAFNYVRCERTNMAQRAVRMHQYLAVKHGNTTCDIETCSTVDR